MRIEIKVIPKASRSEVLEKEGTLRVYVTSPPDKGKANKAVIKLLAEHFDVRKSDVSIVRGEASRSKVIEIAGIKF